MNRATRYLVGTEISEKTLAQAKGSTFVAMNDYSKRYSSYVWRLVLSSVIAAGGIASGSTAVVVGAMLVAPLMSPMIGTPLAIALNDKRAVLRTLFMALAGAAASILVAIVVAAIIPVDVNTSTDPEVVSRVSPRLVDLLIALASGLMAALATIREDIPDAISGVAIAVSLVPPLCVVGIALYAGDFASASGAFLLFLANYFAIELMGLVVFFALDVGHRRAHRGDGKAQARWYALAVLGIVAVSIPLAITSFTMVQANNTQRAVQQAASEWVEGSSYEVVSSSVQNDVARIQVAGQGSLPKLSEFYAKLQAKGSSVKEARVIVFDEFVAYDTSQLALT